MDIGNQDVIRQLIEMDKHARSVVEEAKVKRRESERTLDDEKAGLEREITQRAQTRIEKIKAQTVEEALRRKQKIEAEGESAMRKLAQNYESNHAAWEDALFARCVENTVSTN